MRWCHGLQPTEMAAALDLRGRCWNIRNDPDL